MSKVSGVITEIKKYDGQYGPMFNIIVNGTRYGTGKEAVGKEGDFVEFDVEQKGKFFNAKNVVNKGPPKAEVSAPRAAKPSGGDMSKEDWALKDQRIAFQAARNASIALIGHLLAKDLLPLPKDEKKRVDAVAAASDVITQRFFESSQNLGQKAKEPAKEDDGFDDSPDDIPY